MTCREKVLRLVAKLKFVFGVEKMEFFIFFLWKHAHIYTRTMLLFH